MVNNGNRPHYLNGTNSRAARAVSVAGSRAARFEAARKSGIEVLEYGFGRSLIERIPIVMLTSSRQAVDINRAYDLGVNAYLVKPVAFDALVGMLGSLICSGCAWTSLPTSRGSRVRQV